MQVSQKVVLPALRQMFLLLENVLNYLDCFFTKARLVLKIAIEKLFTVHEKKTILLVFCLCRKWKRLGNG